MSDEIQEIGIVEQKVVEPKTEEIIINSQFQSQRKKLFKLAFQTKWAILTIILTSIASGGSFYVALHPELIWEAANYPYAIAFLAAIPVTIFAIGLVINFSTAIKQFLTIQIDRFKEDKRSLWFEFVIICFIAVSMIEAGPFFAALIKNDFFGYFTIFAIDVTAVQFMQSRKKALIHSDDKKAFLYMVGVVVTALPSMFGNVYNSILNFNLSTTHEPLWMVGIAPTVGVIFPTLIIFLAYTVDADINKKGIVDRYTETENVRIQLLEAQEKSLSRQVEIRERLALLQQRQAFWKNMFFTKNKMKLTAEIVTNQLQTRVDDILNTQLETSVQKAIDSKLQTNNQQLITLQQQVQQLPDQVAEKHRLMQQTLAEYDRQLADVINLIEELRSFKQAIPDLIEEKMQAQLKFVTIQEEKPKQLPSPKKATVEEIKKEEEEKWIVKRLTAREAGYTKSEPRCTIGSFTFVEFPEAVASWDNSKITVDTLKKAYEDHLIESKYFRIVVTSGWGKDKDNVVVLLHPEVKKLLLKLK